MVDSKKIQESLPIELIQKDCIITEEEIEDQPSFVLSVNI